MTRSEWLTLACVMTLPIGMACLAVYGEYLRRDTERKLIEAYSTLRD